MSHLSYGDIADSSLLSRFGCFDYAVPENWLMKDPEKRRFFCWFYSSRPDRRSLFGRPLSYRAIARLALRRMRREDDLDDLHLYIQLFAFAHPGKAIDPYGVALITRYLAAYPRLGLAVTIQNLIADLGMPWPPDSCLPPEWEDQVAA